MASIAENIERITSQLPGATHLVAVSKYHPADKVQQAYDAGQRLFGENHAQELVAKAPLMPTDAQWHFIGHLQTNKARMIMPHVSLIHSIDSLKLLNTVNKEAARINRRVDVLLQLHVAQEESKSGFDVEELLNGFEQGLLNGYDNVRLCGLMAMGSNTTCAEQVAHEFATVQATFATLKERYFAHDEHFKDLSMGMSGDWHIAVEHGSTMVRIGTDIFGPREY